MKLKISVLKLKVCAKKQTAGVVLFIGVVFMTFGVVFFSISIFYGQLRAVETFKENTCSAKLITVKITPLHKLTKVKQFSFATVFWFRNEFSKPINIRNFCSKTENLCLETTVD